MSWRATTIAALAAPGPRALVGGPFGSKLGARDYVATGVPVIRGANLRDDSRYIGGEFVHVSEQKARELEANLAHPGDLVFTQRGTLGQVALIPTSAEHPRYVVSQSQMKLTVDPAKADPRFLYYLFRAPSTAARLIGRSITSGVPHINLAILRRFVVAIPERAEQTRIAERLGAYDALIETNARRLALLEESVHRLFAEWFVRLRYPGRGETPRMVPAAAVIDFNPRTPVGKSEAPFVPMDSLSTTGLGIAPIHARVPKGGARFRRGDTLVARITPCLQNGKTGYVDFLAEGVTATGSTEFLVLRARAVPRTFVYALARSPGFRTAAITTMSGSDGRQRVSREALEQFELPLAPPEVLARWAALTEPVFEQCRLLGEQSRKLAAARDALLPRLLRSGLGQIGIDLGRRAPQGADQEHERRDRPPAQADDDPGVDGSTPRLREHADEHDQADDPE